MEYRYKCIRAKQTSSGEWLAQFAAPAADIDAWAGVPQKTQFGDDSAGETVGFQRDESPKRVRSLGEFCETPKNIIQNPLLCALRTEIDFVASSGQESDKAVQLGRLVIDIPDFEAYSVEDCLRGVREYLEMRDSALRDQTPKENLVKLLKEQASDAGQVWADEDDRKPDNEAGDGADVSYDEMVDGDDSTGALYEESHIWDFWQEVAARHELAKLSNPEFDEDGQYLGLSKDAMLSYLRPVVLVDGQHRLRGAMSAARDRLAHEDVLAESRRRISSGESAAAVEEDLLRRESRLLPISLLMSTDPEEQVFQFVVVNQKATPVGKALLGTIISTTLSDQEMDKVASRLKEAGIEVEESRAITYLARSEESPFCELIDRGLRQVDASNQDHCCPTNSQQKFN